MKVRTCSGPNVGKVEELYTYEQIKEKEGVYVPTMCLGDISSISSAGIFLVVLTNTKYASILEYDMVKGSLCPALSDTWSRFNYTKVDKQVCFSLV